MSTETDLVILGGGSGGYATALRARQLGLSVTLVERDRLGGTCLHQGCVPTKALLHAAELADAARAAPAHGVLASFDGVDMAGVHAYKDRVVERLHTGLQGLVKASGATYVEGEGRMVAPRSVEVDGQVHTGTSLVLATGSRPRSIPGVELGSRVVTSDEALRLDEVPERVVVIGGSVIGVELASVWRSFGAEVTIVEGLPSLVPLEDPAIGRQLERAFRRRGIGFRTDAMVRGVSSSASEVAVTLEGGDVLTADLVLVAVGRGPVTAGLGYEDHGVELARGWVVVDDRLRTSVPGVYAVGDLVPGLQLAHRGFAHGIFVAEEVAGLSPDPVEDADIPRVTYCEPEIASVGLTEPRAREIHGDVTTYEYDLAGNGKSQILGTTGFVKVVRQAGGPIVGVHLLGTRMGEQVGEASLMVNWEAFPEDVAQFVHAHPTQNEALGEAALALAGKPLHAHGRS
ncbi:dihydrolipoyl dehydrogenase [Nocardioides ganghwensis]|jgi:dihydrolipoamide dehydrogenase|uniref:Dihydrolipoyl dehydrogenase n=1 Tax=Nocardioides ganghwensis TaxID=252230 RepID=A0A4Q2SH50_9ACTN|nr:dihydrolipoyl dehydrogenase [Nocardioides ganghwensis]MBD3946530.1 dihydrolipoyl dehydrogenase [Nocardioides ganghwensis]RYC03270.1 dihydrolipoyl dehydrogenase [Nocardioides ganghwensis]